MREIIVERKPLAQTARRAGWIGSHILLNEIPQSGKIYLVRDGRVEPKAAVLKQWKSTLFLRDEGQEARGWLIEVMKCVETIGKTDFNIEDVYAFEKQLGLLYPENKNVKAKIRQQLQFLRDRGYVSRLLSLAIQNRRRRLGIQSTGETVRCPGIATITDALVAITNGKTNGHAPVRMTAPNATRGTCRRIKAMISRKSSKKMAPNSSCCGRPRRQGTSPTIANLVDLRRLQKQKPF